MRKSPVTVGMEHSAINFVSCDDEVECVSAASATGAVVESATPAGEVGIGDTG